MYPPLTEIFTVSFDSCCSSLHQASYNSKASVGGVLFISSVAVLQVVCLSAWTLSAAQDLPAGRCLQQQPAAPYATLIYVTF
jgi:hypothetical protein